MFMAQLTAQISVSDKTGIVELAQALHALNVLLLSTVGTAKLLADAGLYARDPKAFADASAKLTAAQAAKAKAEDEWLELEVIREGLEG